MYSLLAVAALLQLGRLHYFSKPFPTAQKTMHILVAAMAAVRSYFFFQSSGWTGVAFFGAVARIKFDSVDLYVADEAPGLLFFSAYSVLLVLW